MTRGRISRPHEGGHPTSSRRAVMSRDGVGTSMTPIALNAGFVQIFLKDQIKLPDLARNRPRPQQIQCQVNVGLTI